MALELPRLSFEDTDDARRAIMRANRARDTRPELEVRRRLHALGLRFRKHRRPVPHIRCEADVVFARSRVAVFVDGCFWHGCPEHGHTPRKNAQYWRAKIARNTARDRRNDTALTAAGWTVLRFWEHVPADEIAARVCDELAHHG